ncbi:small multidrug efflux protein [Agrococcus sp. 1P02AA]|uniref:small multidrug efflux protein n=1 Tax=Agrococcus sp. 1P02AA TaxID=3132259 RepID=UPI0039A56CD2
MNPIEDLIIGFQELVAQVPELLQPFIVMLAGMIPFIEGEGGSAIGIVGGIHPLIAAIAAAAGNFLAVLAVVLLTSRTRDAVVARRGRAAADAQATQDGAVLTLEGDEGTAAAPAAPAKPESKGRKRFQRWLVRFGVPGASLLGPLAIPTHFTAATLVASGVARGWVLLWQSIAIVLWTTIVTVPLWLVISAVVG